MAAENLHLVVIAHRAQILQYLRSRGAGDDAEDCLQDLWIKARFAGDCGALSPLNYVYRMALNVMLDRMRASQRRIARDTMFNDDVLNSRSGIDSAPPADQVIQAKQSLAKVTSTLATLGPRTDAIFRRCRLDGAPQTRVAVEVGVSVSAIEKHLQKAYRALARERLASECPERIAPVAVFA